MIRRLAWVLLHQGAGRGAVFIFLALLPLRLSLEDAGRFVLVYSAMLILLQPAFDTAVGMLLVRAAARADHTAVAQIVRWALTALAVLALSTGIGASLVAGLDSLWIWLAGYFALSLPLNMTFAICRGYGRFDVEGVVGSLQKLSLLPLLVLLTRSGGDACAPAQALLLSAVLGWTLLGAVHGRAWLVWRRATLADAITSPNDSASLADTLRLTALALVGLVYLRVDLALLAAFSGLRDVGLYSTASRWIEAAYVLPFGVMLVLFPQLASRPAEPGELQMALRTFSLVGLATFSGSLIVAWLLLPAVYPGDAGVEIARLVFCLSPCALAVSLGMFFSQTLVATGRTTQALLAAVVGLVTNLAIAVPAIPRLGATGAAIAGVATEVAVAAAAGVLLWRGLRAAPQRLAPVGADTGLAPY